MDTDHARMWNFPFRTPSPHCSSLGQSPLHVAQAEQLHMAALEPHCLKLHFFNYALRPYNPWYFSWSFFFFFSFFFTEKTVLSSSKPIKVIFSWICIIPQQNRWIVNNDIVWYLIYCIETSWLYFHFIYLFLKFWPHHMAWGILVPQPGIEPVLPSMGAQSLNHGTTREVPNCL